MVNNFPVFWSICQWHLSSSKPCALSSIFSSLGPLVNISWVKSRIQGQQFPCLLVYLSMTSFKLKALCIVINFLVFWCICQWHLSSSKPCALSSIFSSFGLFVNDISRVQSPVHCPQLVHLFEFLFSLFSEWSIVSYKMDCHGVYSLHWISVAEVNFEKFSCSSWVLFL